VDPRIAAHRLGEFTVSELATACGHCRMWANRRVAEMVAQGVVVNTEEYVMRSGRGRPAALYAYVPIPVTQTARRRVPPPELEVVKKVNRAGTVSGTGATLKSGSKNKNALLRKARKQGFKIGRVRNGHIVMTGPKGEKIRTASTPTRDGTVIEERKLRQAGYAA
jgi:hypothetical protein